MFIINETTLFLKPQRIFSSIPSVWVICITYGFILELSKLKSNTASPICNMLMTFDVSWQGCQVPSGLSLISRIPLALIFHAHCVSSGQGLSATPEHFWHVCGFHCWPATLLSFAPFAPFLHYFVLWFWTTSRLFCASVPVLALCSPLYSSVAQWVRGAAYRVRMLGEAMIQGTVYAMSVLSEVLWPARAAQLFYGNVILQEL